uniref:Uncharacterized protein n=1 Tax=Cacopsylla melanoneura TaxID=428564 RepID=A0A8D9AVL4_9HEMI
MGNPVAGDRIHDTDRLNTSFLYAGHSYKFMTPPGIERGPAACKPTTPWELTANYSRRLVSSISNDTYYGTLEYIVSILAYFVRLSGFVLMTSIHCYVTS